MTGDGGAPKVPALSLTIHIYFLIKAKTIKPHDVSFYAVITCYSRDSVDVSIETIKT